MIAIKSAQGFTTNELRKLQLAIYWSENVMNSLAFQTAVVNYQLPNGSHQFTGVLEANATIFKNIHESSKAMDFEIQSYSWWNFAKRKEVAHEGPNGPVFNRKFFSTQTLPSLVNTVVHEYCHALGYSHDYYPTDNRPYSVPYAVGAIVEEIARQFIPKASW